MEPQSETKSTTTSHVAQLAGARMPADYGLTGLGLLMQLTGSICLVYGAFLALTPLLESAGGGPRMQIFLIGVASLVRSAFHRSAGGALLYGASKGPMHALKLYIGVALAQSVVVTLLLHNMDVETQYKLFALTVLVAWPCTLAILLRTRRFKSIGSDLPKAEDMGFESAAVLMTIFGIMGSLATGLFIVTLIKANLVSMREVPSLLWLAMLVMLFVRSLLHARAGLQGTRGVDTDRASESASRYFNYGVMISVVAGATLMLQMVMMSARMHMALFAMAAMVTYLLLIWPMTLRTFFTDRNFSMLLDEDTVARRAPDTGLTALGWMLVGLGVMGLALSLGSELFLKAGDQGADFMMLSQLAGGPGTHSMWWSIGIAGLQLAAGLELISMSDRHRIVATAYGAVAVLVSLYLWWPAIKSFSGGDMMATMGSMSLYAELLLGMTVPVATLFLVNRDTAPDARARITDPS